MDEENLVIESKWNFKELYIALYLIFLAVGWFGHDLYNKKYFMLKDECRELTNNCVMTKNMVREAVRQSKGTYSGGKFQICSEWDKVP